MMSLVTGAGGYIGSALAAHLANDGDEVLLHYLSRKPVTPGVAVQADFRREELESTLLDGVETVYHCAGIAHQGAAAEDYQRVNHRAALRLAEQAMAAGVRRFVFLSSVKAVAAATAYGRFRKNTEQQLRQLAGRGMAVVCVRPALVYGPGVPGNLAVLIRAVRYGLPLPPELGARSLVARGDLLRLLRVMGSAELPDYSLYEVTDGECYSSRRLCLAIRQALHKSGRGWTAPRASWRLACSLADVFRAGDEPLYDKLFAEECFSNQLVMDYFDWRPAYRFEDLAAQMVEGR
ncbi:MAG: NAD-dependent epimerase/dehydratase family protein [Halieaceae bacterium]|nr:NAD-dependent epimerase/dehydratase family protein [Halieaceae bacterium]